MYFKQVAVGGYDRNFSYLIGDEKTREIAVVDPDNLGLLTTLINQHGLRVVAIIVTHEHHDHIVGVQGMVEKYNVPVYIHSEGRDCIEEFDVDVIEIEEGDVIKIGGVEIEVIHTPGHAPGAVCFLADNKLITGDTLFVGSCGHCGLKGCNIDQMYESLMRLAKLPDDTEVYPGHDYGDQPFSTIGREKEHNRYMCCKSKQEFIDKRMG